MNKKENHYPLIVANWKMNGSLTSSPNFAHKLARLAEIDKCYYQLVICPPFSLLFTLNNIFNNTDILLGAQDCSLISDNYGSFTGEISAFMLSELGCKLVILGHAERRKFNNESNQVIKQKIISAQKQGLHIILCVGETAEEFANNQSKEVVKKQLFESLDTNIPFTNLSIAYEPVWAIGSGKAASVEKISEMVDFIDSTLNELNLASLKFENPIKIVYGGSVKKENARELLTIPKVKGLLVGAASLDYDQFSAILEECK